MLKLAFVSLSGCKFFIQISYLIDRWINKNIMKNFVILTKKKKKKKKKKQLKMMKCCITILPVCHSV